MREEWLMEGPGGYSELVLASIQVLLEFGKDIFRAFLIDAFFLTDHLIELAFQAVADFGGKGALCLSAAKRASDGPTGPASVPAGVRAVQTGFRGSWAYAEFIRFASARFTATLLMFPAILFHDCDYPEPRLRLVLV
jgi:hypothetical protein